MRECKRKRYSYFILDVAVWWYRRVVVRLVVAGRGDIIVVSIDVTKNRESYYRMQ